ncbi:hypothetical protein K6Y31_06205 [Motilimonas cestriensis]|uniref:Uncharacterized protein n=1 Tax=Motilimonas cestriensis TaxID=2742685 RepID=A0ABS8W8G6_9GAMM|nr:hypothetical protein [Motilimonas cestriensis]MCE2594402.1 hypothetical protein [Motilimonas cestriensis]
MAAPILYKHDDPGAPQLDGSKGSILNMLIKCLVEGFGARAGAGWQIAFDLRAEHCAILAPSDNGWFYRFNDAHTSVFGSAYCLFDTCESFIDFNNVSSVISYPPLSGRVSNALHQGILRSTNWWVVADNNTCYIITIHQGHPMFCCLGRAKAGATNTTQVSLGADAYWSDDDAYKLGRPDRGIIDFPISDNIHKQTHDMLKTTSNLISGGKANYGTQPLYSDGLYTGIAFRDSSNRVTCVMPGFFGALFSPHTQKEFGETDSEYVYFPGYAISLNDWWV